MRVSPVELNACGSCNFQPLINSLRPDKPTVFDDISGESIDKTNPATLLFSAINKLNQGAYGPKDRVIRDSGFVNLWLQFPNSIIRDLAMQIVNSQDSDDEWVAVDFSYYPDLRPMDYRMPLKDDEKYVDDYFFITNQYIAVTENTNRIRDPEVYYADGGVIPNIFFPTGSLLSRYA